MNGHIQRILSGIKKKGIDAMLITRRSNLFYSFDFEADEGDGTGIISEKGSWFITDARYAKDARKAMPGIEVIELPQYSSYLRKIGNIMYNHKLRKIGYEGSMSVEHLKACEKYLWGELTEAEEIVLDARREKDEEELLRIQAVQEIADQAFRELLHELRPGITEREASAKLQYLLLKLGADEIVTPILVQSGKNGGCPHRRPTDRRLKSGEFITIDFVCRKDGYCTDTARTIALGKADEGMRSLYQAALEAQKAGLEKAVIGGKLAASDLASRQALAERGYDDGYDHAFGHGIGIDAHEEPFSGIGIAGDYFEGIVLTAEPGIYIPDKMGVRVEDTFTIKDNQVKCFSTLDRQLLIL